MVSYQRISGCVESVSPDTPRKGFLVSAETWGGLVGALIGAPALPGARCRGRSHLFDEANPGETPEVVQARHKQAIGLCSRCPAAAPCLAYVESQPARRRHTGIVAGRLYRTPTARTAQP